MLVPYLNNPSAEEALFGSNKIKDEHDFTSKQRSYAQKHLKILDR